MLTLLISHLLTYLLFPRTRHAVMSLGLCVQLQLSFDSYDGSLNVHVIQARRLRVRADNTGVDPYVKLCLLPGRRYTAV